MCQLLVCQFSPERDTEEEEEKVFANITSSPWGPLVCGNWTPLLSSNKGPITTPPIPLLSGCHFGPPTQQKGPQGLILLQRYKWYPPPRSPHSWHPGRNQLDKKKWQCSHNSPLTPPLLHPCPPPWGSFCGQEADKGQDPGELEVTIPSKECNHKALRVSWPASETFLRATSPFCNKQLITCCSAPSLIYSTLAHFKCVN